MMPNTPPNRKDRQALAQICSAESAAFRRRLLRWFDRHGRKSFPWQQQRDPYGIWVAEIMLQQTQVRTVIPYYRKFMARMPNIAALAGCGEDELLHCWSGLGYYARARNLRAAACQIIAKHGGRFPRHFAEVLALPGIGRSTAGAILAFAWEQPHPILDGNVKRVLTRHYAVAGYPGDKDVQARLWQLAEQLLPNTRIADYTQAMMDLGAVVCLRAKPRCGECPVQPSCAAFARGQPTAYPYPKPKVARPRKAVTMLVVQNHRGERLLVKRPPSGIWGGLWSLPEYTSADAVKHPAVEMWFAQQFGFAIETFEPLPPLKHSFTHFDLDILPLPASPSAQTGTRIMDAAQHLWYNPLSPAQVGVPTAVNRVLERFDDAQSAMRKVG